MEMLREEILYWEDNKPIPITRHTLPIEEVREYQHCYKKDYNREDCQLLYPEKKKEK